MKITKFSEVYGNENIITGTKPIFGVLSLRSMVFHFPIAPSPLLYLAFYFYDLVCVIFLFFGYFWLSANLFSLKQSPLFLNFNGFFHRSSSGRGSYVFERHPLCPWLGERGLCRFLAMFTFQIELYSKIIHYFCFCVETCSSSMSPQCLLQCIILSEHL